MTSYTSEIMVSSAIVVAALGVAVYIDNELRKSLDDLTPIRLRASDIHAKAWGKRWPQSQGTIHKTEISNETDSIDDDEIYGIADKLVVPPKFNYRYFKGVQSLKRALGADSGQIIEDILVIRDEYEMLRQVLENHPKSQTKSIVVTGHPGIGSYESWFSSLDSNADFSPILRQKHVPPLPSFISS
jgi:hypothetical protein